VAAKEVYPAHVSSKRPTYVEDDLGQPGPFDPAETNDLWFLPPDDDADPGLFAPLHPARPVSLVEAAEWLAAERALAADLADLSFDLGRLAERTATAGNGVVQRLALEEAASLSWWTGDRMTSDRLALWLSYRIGAAEAGGEGLIRTAWAARRLASKGQGSDLADSLRMDLGEDGRANAGLIADVTAEMAALAGASAVTKGAALFHLWRALDERPDHLRGLEAAVLATRCAARRGGLPFLPISLTGFTALTISGSPEARLTGWITGAHRAVLAALMALDRLAEWRARADTVTADLSGRTTARLIDALAAYPMLTAAQAETATGASRAAVQRNLDELARRSLVREVTGHGRFRVWTARV
jgi:hypothetical protein